VQQQYPLVQHPLRTTGSLMIVVVDHQHLLLLVAAHEQPLPFVVQQPLPFVVQQPLSFVVQPQMSDS
jgi:hypothetical protein